MAGITSEDIKTLVAKPGYGTIQTAIETGTFQARTSRILRENFRTVHTIELQPERWRKCVDLYACLGIQFHFGDSASLVPMLCRAYADVPCLWLLDAHWFDMTNHSPEDWTIPVADENPFPLWNELDAILQRRQADIVIVDDVHAFGRSLSCWEAVTKESLDVKLAARLKESAIIRDVYAAWLIGGQK